MAGNTWTNMNGTTMFAGGTWGFGVDRGFEMALGSPRVSTDKQYTPLLSENL